MKASLLVLQQYLKVHPVLEKKEKLRREYAALLRYFADGNGEKDLWSEQLLRLYTETIAGEETEAQGSKLKDLGLFEKIGFSAYRYLLLTDSLFIGSFDDREKGEQILQKCLSFWGKRYNKKMRFIFDAFYRPEDKDPDALSPQLRAIYEIVRKDRAFFEISTKRIMITANMSAGKSTLLNALTGKKVNRTQNDTCTAKIHFLHNKAGEDGLIYEWDHDLELNASTDILMDDNINNDSPEIHVGTRFRSVEEIDGKICFIDTPGVNSSMDRSHRQLTNDAVKNLECDLLIYLFNAENIGSDDDLNHLRFVKENHKGPVLFIVNRLDRFKKGADSVPETLASVKQDLCRLGFEEPEVYPVSAYAGYLAKMAMYGGELSEDEKDDLEFVKRKLKKEEFSYEKYYPEEGVDLHDPPDEEQLLLMHSGIPALEKRIYSQGKGGVL